MSKNLSTKVIVRAAVLMALSVIMTRFLGVMVPLAGMQAKRIAFGFVPLMMAGYLFGPIIGGIVGLGADIIGVMMNPMGQFHPGFMVSSMLTGLLPGLVMLAIGGNNQHGKKKLYGLWISTALVTIVIHIFLNNLWLKDIFHTGYLVLLPLRLPLAVVEGIVGGVIFVLLMKIMERIDPRGVSV
ncbi:MAG: folate family ECF transporter S component [Tissierellia bacterium]|nr:folate family ECF transporter S component [Tissierellia bacterium]